MTWQHSARRLVLMAGLLLALALAGCGGRSSDTPENTEPAANATEAGATDAGATDTDATDAGETESGAAASAPAAAPSEPAGQPADVAAVYDLPDLGGRTVVAVTANDYIPLNYVDPLSGEAEGLEYDAVNEICRRLNCVVDWQVSAWDTMISAVRAGQFDVGMDGITITEERAEQVDFSIPYLRSQQFMLVRADESRFTTPEEFAAITDLLIGSQAGTTSFYTAVYEILDGNESNPRIILFENFGASVQALLNGDVDMVLVDAASGEGYIGANPDQLKIIGNPLATEDFGFIFTPGSDLVEPFNQAIDMMTRDGYFYHLSTRWFYLNDPNAEDVYEQMPDLGGRSVVAVTANDYLPLNFVDPTTGEAVGWEYDAVEEICRRINCVVDWQVAAWDTMIAAVNQGQFDVGMDGITITDERAAQVSFSIPYMTSQQYLLVRADEDRFINAEEFAANPELLAGAQPGTTGYFITVEQLLGGDESSNRLVQFENFGAAVQALINGDIDALLTDTATGKGYVGANPQALKITGPALATENFGFIFPPEHDLVEPFNAALRTMIQDNFVQYLNNKWYYLYVSATN
jgi:polar amino acid transport system substrate-binding protein